MPSLHSIRNVPFPLIEPLLCASSGCCGSRSAVSPAQKSQSPPVPLQIPPGSPRPVSLSQCGCAVLLRGLQQPPALQRHLLEQQPVQAHGSGSCFKPILERLLVIELNFFSSSCEVLFCYEIAEPALAVICRGRILLSNELPGLVELRCCFCCGKTVFKWQSFEWLRANLKSVI